MNDGPSGRPGDDSLPPPDGPEIGEGPLLALVQFPGVLRLHRPSGSSGGEPVPDLEGLHRLADRRPRTAREVGLLMATLARTVAEVHRAGVAHGSLTPGAVLVDDRGRPVLRDFGRARRITTPDEGRHDVTGLVDLTETLMAQLERAPDSEEARRRRRLRRSLRRSEPTSAIDLSDRLASTVRPFDADGQGTSGQETDGDHRPDPDDPVPVQPTSDRALRARVLTRVRATRPDRRIRLAAATGLLGVLMGAGWLLAGDQDRADPPPEAGRPAAGTSTATPDSLPVPPTGSPEVVHDGWTYRVGLPGDVAVLRSCEGQASVWLLRPSTGDLYRFDHLAEADPVSTAPLRHDPGATDLSVHRAGDCDHLRLGFPDGTHVELTDTVAAAD